MKIEDEIIQKKFTNEFQKAMINIFFTNGWLASKHSAVFKPYGLTLQQYNILRILRGQHPNPATIRLLTERMLDKMSNASRLVEKLRKKKLLERKTCKNDRRQVNIVISQNGLDLLQELDEVVAQLKLDTVEKITEAEAVELNRILDKIRS